MMVSFSPPNLASPPQTLRSAGDSETALGRELEGLRQQHAMEASKLQQEVGAKVGLQVEGSVALCAWWDPLAVAACVVRTLWCSLSLYLSLSLTSQAIQVEEKESQLASQALQLQSKEEVRGGSSMTRE